MCLFGKITNGEMCLNEKGKIVEQCWLDIPQHYPNVVLHEYIVMPNHIHGIIELTDGIDIPSVGVENFRPENNKKVENFRPLQSRPNCQSRSVGAIVRGFKIGTTKQFGNSVWQRNYYEHIIRNANDYNRIAQYIIYNPENWKNDKYYIE
jgi:REP element-mobilizing transposase RayT